MEEQHVLEGIQPISMLDSYMDEDGKHGLEQVCIKNTWCYCLGERVGEMCCLPACLPVSSFFLAVLLSWSFMWMESFQEK